MGVSDMLFEVIYGAGEGLHSKFNEVFHQIILYFQSNSNNHSLSILIRCLLLKLLNEVDTEKQ